MKKVISVFMCLAMATTLLVGCGSKSEETASTMSSNKATETGTEMGAKASGDIDWPKKEIQIICPFAAGGDTDFNARTYAQYLTDELGQKVVVISTDGNGGATGARAGKDAANDGYNVLFTSSAFLTNQLSGAVDFGFDAFEFSAIAGASAGNVVTVNKELGVSSFEELVEYSKEHPGELKMAANTGATTQAIALMVKEAGVDASIVDSGGSSDRIAALLGGQIDIIINNYGSIKDYLANGDFVAIGLDTATPNAIMKETGLTTCKEQGYDVVFPSYYFFMFPKGTDPAIVQKFSEAVQKVAENNKEYAESIATAYYQVPVYYNSEEGLKLMEEALTSLDKFKDEFKN